MSDHETIEKRLGRGGRPVRVIHRVNQRIVTTFCRSVRDSNLGGFVELEGVTATTLPEVLGQPELENAITSLVLPKLVVVAICYPGEQGERVVPFPGASVEEEPEA